MRVLVTGAGGFIGRLFVDRMAGRPDLQLIATDIRELPDRPGVENRHLDIRSEMAQHFAGVDVVVHLAAMVTPPAGATRELLHEVEVEGTRRVLQACLDAGVRKLVYTSSGAAYGYSPENASLLFEEDPLRSDEVFPYAWHKRLVEEMLAQARQEHPELEQLVFRVSTILGPTVDNDITALFEGRVVVGLRGVDSPFCLVEDEDVVACLVQGVLGPQTGVFNLTGDGVMTLREVAAGMRRPFLALPRRVLEGTIRRLARHGLTRNTPEQVLFLAHRPVLSNQALKRDFGYTPRRSTRQVFERYRASRV